MATAQANADSANAALAIAQVALDAKDPNDNVAETKAVSDA